MKLMVKEIADMAGVSVTAVPQIPNNKRSRSSEKTRNEVLAVVVENHYKPDYSALSVINRYSKTISMIVLDVTDFFFSKVIGGVETYLSSSGYAILLYDSKHDSEQAMQYVSELIYRSVDGTIFATPNALLENHILKDRQEHSIPVVLIDHGVNLRGSGRLIVREYEGAHQATHRLIRQGHQHIGMLRESADYCRLTERVVAYQHVLQDNSLSFRPYYTCARELNSHGGYVAIKEVPESEEITTIFRGSDEMAVEAYQTIGETGKKIPNDVSVVGFNGLEISEYLVPSSTTVHQPSFGIGYYAAKFLVEAIVDPIGKVLNEVFDATFIVRKSTKPI